MWWRLFLAAANSTGNALIIYFFILQLPETKQLLRLRQYAHGTTALIFLTALSGKAFTFCCPVCDSFLSVGLVFSFGSIGDCEQPHPFSGKATSVRDLIVKNLLTGLSWTGGDEPSSLPAISVYIAKRNSRSSWALEWELCNLEWHLCLLWWSHFLLWNCRCLCGRAGCWPCVQFLPQNGGALDPRWSPCLHPRAEKYLWESYNCTVWSQDLGKCCLPDMSGPLLGCLLQPSCLLWAVVLSAWVISKVSKGPESVLPVCFFRKRKFSIVIYFQCGLLP